MIPFCLVAVRSLSAAVLAGLGRAALPLAAGGIATALNLALDVTLIPRYGAEGAAIATGAAQFTASGLMLVVALHIAGPVRWELAALSRDALAAAGCGLAGWWGVSLFPGALGLFVGMAAGFAVFVMLALVLRVVPEADAVWAEESLGHRLGGRVGRIARRASARRRT